MSAAVAWGAPAYPWLASADGTSPFAQRFAPPEGYTRVEAEAGSFAEWLRGLPLEPGRPEVLLFNGARKRNQLAHLAVVRLDVGTRDLQQCADAAMRLRAEYLWSIGRAQDVCFTLTNGDPAPWIRWSRGERPAVKGNRVSWALREPTDASHAEFQRYLEFVFTYAGSASLAAHDLEPAASGKVAPGDLFIQGGFPGHAVVVIDVAQDERGEQAMALAQSYMPAQQLHVLDNPARPGSPWYSVTLKDPLRTPEWTFAPGAHRRFRARACSR